MVLMAVGNKAAAWPKLGREAMIAAEPVLGPRMLASPTTLQPSRLPTRIADTEPHNDSP